MTEVRPRHLLFFILIFILNWFCNWIAILFMGIIIISMCIELYWTSFKKQALRKNSAHINCVYYNGNDTMSCMHSQIMGACDGMCKHFMIKKT